MNEQLKRFDALCSIATLLEQRGYWTSRSDITIDVADTVRDLFHSLAWADRSLHDAECRLFESLFEVGSAPSLTLQEAFGSERAANPVPGCLVAAALHDSIYKTSFSVLFLNHLENIGRLIVMADGQLAPSEVDALQQHLLAMRRRIADPGSG